MDPNQLVDFLMQRKWVALAACLIGLIVRLLKSDTKIPIDIPPKLRVWLAIGLGGAAGALDKMVEAGETTWTSALTKGVVAAVIAIVSHNLFIDSVRGGKELVVPGLTKENTPPGPGKPPSIPPTALQEAVMITIADAKKDDRLPRTVFRNVTALVLCAWMMGCALFTKENAPHTILTVEQITCLAENAFLNDTALNALCKLLTGEEQAAGSRVANATRVGMSKAPKPTSACTPDAGTAPDGGK